MEQVQILIDHDLAWTNEYDDAPYIYLSVGGLDWPEMWSDLREYSRRAKVPLRDLIVDLRFDLLD
jgi:hypothetical protein